MADALVAVAATIAIVWGIAHIMPTRQVVAGFGDIGTDNRWVITMEWVAEGMTLVFLGVLPLVVMLTSNEGDGAALTTYRLAAGMLFVMAVWTAATGARTSVGFFKACPIVKSAAATLLIIASFV